jgi:hypothetical protein
MDVPIADDYKRIGALSTLMMSVMAQSISLKKVLPMRTGFVLMVDQQEVTPL